MSVADEVQKGTEQPNEAQPFGQTMPEEQQQQLIERIASGDKAAFEQLFKAFGERVFRYAYRLISDQEKAEEVTNDVMLQVWKNAAKFAGRSKVSTWILGITRHVALNAVRRKEFDTVDIDDAPEPVVETSASPLVAQDRIKLKTELSRVLTKLSPEHRDVVELTFFHGCSYQEIAEIVGCPTNTVKTRMHHAKKLLSGFLTAAGLDPSVVEVAS